MAIIKLQAEGINLADTFAFTGTVTGAGGTTAPYFFASFSKDVFLRLKMFFKIWFFKSWKNHNNSHMRSVGRLMGPT